MYIMIYQYYNVSELCVIFAKHSYFVPSHPIGEEILRLIYVVMLDRLLARFIFEILLEIIACNNTSELLRQEMHFVFLFIVIRAVFQVASVMYIRCYHFIKYLKNHRKEGSLDSYPFDIPDIAICVAPSPS